MFGPPAQRDPSPSHLVADVSAAISELGIVESAILGLLQEIADDFTQGAETLSVVEGFFEVEQIPRPCFEQEN